ncbi:MAG: hypothetical protein JWO48_1202 [Bryobacterales bacterium]|nr:hypothetical protein [Bryobacterales bacterium]
MLRDDEAEERLVVLIGELMVGDVRDLSDTYQAAKLFLRKERLLAQLEMVDRYRFGKYPNAAAMLKDLDKLNSEIGTLRRTREERRKKKT